MVRPRIKASDFDLKEQTVKINRVTKVVEGGRTFSFTAIVVVGNQKGVVGYGSGKAKEVAEAVRKATERARKRLIRVPLRRGTLWHEALGSFKAARALLIPAAPGTGVKAGAAIRVIAKMAGIQNLLSKAKRSTNPHNLVKATFDALEQQQSAKMVADRRGISLDKLFNG